MDYEHKKSRLYALFEGKKGVAVAFSGGVDSAVLAKVAKDVLGESAVAITVKSETLPERELKSAQDCASHIGITHIVIEHSDLNDGVIRRNPPERCFYCRRNMIKRLKTVVEELGLDTLVEGVTISDFDEHRPGIRASIEEGVWHPFVDVGMSKEDVRNLAKELHLPVADKPSNACLSSRIPYGEPITEDILRRIEKSEDLLYDLGFKQVRVRTHQGIIARIEVDTDSLHKLMDNTIRAKIIDGLKNLGYVYITVDLEGYRSGSLDAVL